MDRIEKILKNKDFIKYCRKNEKSEKKRKFCKHGIEHFVDVARIAYIYNIENALGFDRDIIYGAALLHDIGKWKQYKHNIPHNEASAELAEGILKAVGYGRGEREVILSAILTHRDYSGDKSALNYVLFHADKKSRLCFKCEAEEDCGWEAEKKNMTLYI